MTSVSTSAGFASVRLAAACAVALLFAPRSLCAQLGLQDVLTAAPTAVLVNPAAELPERLTFQLASYGTSTQLSFRPEDIGRREDGGLVISPAAVSATLPEEADGRLSIDASTLLVNVRRDGYAFGFHHGVRAFADVVAPRATLSLIAEGNRVAIGAPLRVLPKGYFSTWHEVGAHYSRDLGERVRIGGRVKLLLGASDIRLDGEQRADLAVAAGSYAVAYDIDAEGLSAGYGLDFGGDTVATPQLTFGPGAGAGAAVDLGIVVSPSEGFRFGVGVRDLGAIRWGTGRRHSATASGVYRGAEGNVFAEDFSLTAVASYDSVRRRLNLATAEEGYGRRLPAKLTAHASRTLTDRLSVGAVATALFSTETTTVNAGVSGAYRLSEYVALGLLIGAGSEGGFVGGSVEARLGPVRVVAASDQALGLANQYGPRSTHGRVGVAWVVE